MAVWIKTPKDERYGASEGEIELWRKKLFRTAYYVNLNKEEPLSLRYMARYLTILKEEKNKNKKKKSIW